ncbi:BlaI/MecI/CopY family transcriptional regulator, partial [Clostridioides difficile]|nr:BlaI/MecI/CopY family transcriptional regulator [Clostridioides difficile]HBF4979673.1 BlaI/MecI/CopY family transcriptional regulator [Clostridioides difficile]
MKKIPKTEHMVMNFIWSQNKSKVSSKDIANYMAEEYNWFKGTTGKVLSRLSDKGFLEPEKEGRNTIYNVKINRDEYIKFETEEFFSFVHHNSIHSFISALGEGEDIS